MSDLITGLEMPNEYLSHISLYESETRHNWIASLRAMIAERDAAIGAKEDLQKQLDALHGRPFSWRAYEALVSRAEVAEAQLCRARDRVIDALNRNQAPMPACQDVVDALMKESAPCRHELEVKRLREAEGWIKQQFRGEKLHHLGLRYSNRDNETYFSIAMEDGSDSEGRTIFDAVAELRRRAKGVMNEISGCKGEAMSETATIICEQCGEPFESAFYGKRMKEYHEMKCDIYDLRDRLALAERVVEAAKLKRNTVIYDDPKFEGRWVAVPEEDFDALTAALAALKEKEAQIG